MSNGTINFRGREYKTVALRVQEFRAAFPIADGWSIRTLPVTVSADVVVFRAAVVDPSEREVAVGYAEERRSKRGVNATSAVENCETSAIGRALAAAGFAGTEYASADELARAVSSETTPSPEERAERERQRIDDALAFTRADVRERRERQLAAQELIALAKDFTRTLHDYNLTVDQVRDYCSARGLDDPTTIEEARRGAFVRWITGPSEGARKILEWSANNA